MTNSSTARVATPTKNSISRRSFLKAGGAGAVAPAVHVALPRNVTGAPIKELPTSLAETSATQLAQMILHKQVSSEEVVHAHIARIKEVNPKINAVVVLTENGAIKRAQEADRALAKGKVWGPLHGVPVTIKDEFETAGIVSTNGALGWKDNVPEKDATGVQRYKKAGAVVLGKTNVPEFSMYFQSDNLVYGPTRNPYDPNRTVGGSSGGEAAIIAANGSPLGFGADGGGSLRNPAHCSGVATVKPTFGRVPLTGMMAGPGFPGGFVFGTAGPLARHIEDVALALRILNGSDAYDPFSVPAPLEDYRRVDLTQLKIGFYTSLPYRPATKGIQDAVTSAANAFDSVAAEVTERTPPSVGTYRDWKMLKILVASGYNESIAAMMEKHNGGRSHALIQQALAYWNEETTKHDAANPRIIGQAHDWWYDMQSGLRTFFATEVDALICPVWPQVAEPHAVTPDNVDMQAYANSIEDCAYTVMYNAGIVPGAVVRAGTSENGLPIGVQVISGPFNDHIALAVAAYLEGQHFGGYRKPNI